MPSYEYSGLIVHSNVALPELTPVDTTRVDCAFDLRPARDAAPAEMEWFYHWLQPDGEPWLSVARADTNLLLRFADLIDFEITDDTSQIRAYPLPDIPVETVRHLFLDQIVPFVLSRRGRVVLHASAVVTPAGAVAFLGESGHGKSTLSASFSQAGFAVLTDDCLVLEEAADRLVAVPSYPGVRLWPDSLVGLFGQEGILTPVTHYSDKKRVCAGSGRITFGVEGATLKRAYVLTPPEEAEGGGVAITPLPLRDAVMVLVEHAYRLDVTDRRGLSEELGRLSRVAELLPVSRLAYPREFAALPAVHAAVFSELRGEAVG